MKRTFRLESSNSPRILAILLRSVRATCRNFNASFTVLSESPTEVVIATDCEPKILDDLASKVREECFPNEEMYLTLLTEVGHVI